MLSERDEYRPHEAKTHHELIARETRSVRDHIRIETQYRAHEQHSITEAQLQATLDSMLEGCQILDLDLRYVYLNQNAIRHSRKQPDELIGHRIQDVYRGFELLPVYQALRECLETQIPRQMEQRLTFADGSIGDFELSLLPGSDGLVLLSYEITERKRAEAELRASEQRFREGQERFRLALDAAAFGTWQYDYGSNRVWVDEICQSHNGLSCSVVEPYEAYRRIHPADMPALRDAAETALNRTDGNGCFSGNYRIVHADGSYRWISLSARFQLAIVQGRRVPIQIHGLTNDITEKMLAEMTARRQSAVLEQIAAGKPLQTVLEEIVALVEDQFPESYCSICLADLKLNQLRFAAGKKLPAEFVQAAAAIPIGPQCGSCGTAAYLKRPVLTMDIATDPLWAGSREIALKHRFRSCWSTPILTTPGDEANESTAPFLLGMFSVYRKDPSPLPPGADGTIAAAVHLARLAIERENSNQAIRQSEARYSAISEITRSVTFALRIDTHGFLTIEWAQPRFSLLSGYTEEECNQLGFSALILPIDRQRIIDRLRQFAEGTSTRKVREEFRLVTKSGTVANVLIQALFYEAGPKPGECLVIGGLLDISDLKSTESALQASQERFQLALRGANDGLWDWDIKKDHFFFSPRWKSMLGYEDHELTNCHQTWIDLVHPEDRELMLARLHDFLSDTTEQYENEFRMRHRSGDYLNILARAFVLRDNQGHPTRMVGTHQDVTEQKLASEELLNSRERLKTLSKQLIASREAELRHLARELHDEVGQSLTLMKMNLRNIQKQCHESLQMLLDENIAMIERTTDQVRSLSLDMRPPHLDDLGLVATLHWYLKQQAKVVGFQEKITVIPPDLCVPIELATVCFRITQEAVTNAIRYASPSRIEIELHKHGAVLDLTISDDGLGFDFSTARQKALEGSSLGLLNMEERASLAGGQMEIVSAPNQGTTIRVRFPQSQTCVTEGSNL